MNATEQQVTAKKTRGQWHRVKGSDFSTAEEILKAAAYMIVPDDQTQRAAIEKLMPLLYVLKNKGLSCGSVEGRSHVA